MVCFGRATIAAGELSVSSSCVARLRLNPLIRSGFTQSGVKDKAAAAVHPAEIQ